MRSITEDMAILYLYKEIKYNCWNTGCFLVASTIVTAVIDVTMVSGGLALKIGIKEEESVLTCSWGHSNSLLSSYKCRYLSSMSASVSPPSRIHTVARRLLGIPWNQCYLLSLNTFSRCIVHLLASCLSNTGQQSTLTAVATSPCLRFEVNVMPRTYEKVDA